MQPTEYRDAKKVMTFITLVYNAHLLILFCLWIFIASYVGWRNSNRIRELMRGVKWACGEGWVTWIVSSEPPFRWRHRSARSLSATRPVVQARYLPRYAANGLSGPRILWAPTCSVSTWEHKWRIVAFPNKSEHTSRTRPSAQNLHKFEGYPACKGLRRGRGRLPKSFKSSNNTQSHTKSQNEGHAQTYICSRCHAAMQGW